MFLGSEDATAPLPAARPRTAATRAARTGSTPTSRAGSAAHQTGGASDTRAGATATRAGATADARTAATSTRTGTTATREAASVDARTAASDTRTGATQIRAGGAPARTGVSPAVRASSSSRRPGRTSGAAASSGALAARRTAPVTPSAGVVAQGSAARFAERARAHRRLTQRRILIAAGAVVAVVGVAWLLFFSPVLALDATQVEVSGADSVVAMDQVQAVVDSRDGVPLPRVDTSALRSELLEVPGVRDATVTRQWPHGLSVALVAREPVAAVPEDADVVQSAEGTPAGAGFALVDEEGVQVGRADAPPEGLPVVAVPVGEERVLSAVLGVLEQLPPDLLAQVGEVAATTQDSVNFTLRDGATVEWGSDQESALKAAVLGALRAAPETAGAARYDVSAPTMPVVG
ncbi:cell division protein FtsQ/DivIB [Cellulomonas sp. NPDC089187]|uniref:cell division protein FtsQ/DivIB n=1 Tax=Cellulomonas sp. NPDC089187 TaxID=3154970 RepID=UPI0034235822